MDGNLSLQQFAQHLHQPINPSPTAPTHRQQTSPATFFKCFFFSVQLRQNCPRLPVIKDKGRYFPKENSSIKEGKGNYSLLFLTKNKRALPFFLSLATVFLQGLAICLTVIGGDTSRTGLDNDHFHFMNPCFPLEAIFFLPPFFGHPSNPLWHFRAWKCDGDLGRGCSKGGVNKKMRKR
jgi:hypothetical protein